VKRLVPCLLAVIALDAAALEGATMERPMCDPCVPQVLRKQARVAAEAPTRGASLQAQVEAKLRAPFDAAAVDGVLTRDRAAAAGLGFIARHFDEIDREGRGTIRFGDYRRFLAERGGHVVE
jgi:hypothetical protein